MAGQGWRAMGGESHLDSTPSRIPLLSFQRRGGKGKGGRRRRKEGGRPPPLVQFGLGKGGARHLPWPASSPSLWPIRSINFLGGFR